MQHKFYLRKERLMKVKVIKEAYYNDEFLKVGRIVDYKCKKDEQLPSWATLADGIETKKEKQQKAQDVKTPANTPDVKGENKAPADNGTTPANNEVQGETENQNETETVQDKGDVFDEYFGDSEAQDNTDNEQIIPDAPQITSPEAEAYLELLINEGIEKNILIEDADKKTVKEQIEELEKALGRKKEDRPCVLLQQQQ